MNLLSTAVDGIPWPCHAMDGRIFAQRPLEDARACSLPRLARLRGWLPLPPPLLYETSVSFSHPPRLHPNTFCRGLGGIHFPFPPSPSGLPLHYQVHRASISCSTAVDSWLALPTPPRTTSLFRIQATIIAREHWMRGSAIAAGAPPPSAIHNYCVEPEPEPYSYQVDQVVAPKRRSQCPKCHAH